MTTNPYAPGIRHDKNGQYFLSLSHEMLRYANELEAVDRDGDAMLARENAYWLAQEATESFWCAYRERVVLANKPVTSA